MPEFWTKVTMVSSPTFACASFKTSGTPYDNCGAVWLADAVAAVLVALAAGVVVDVVESCAATVIAERANTVMTAIARSGFGKI